MPTNALEGRVLTCDNDGLGIWQDLPPYQTVSLQTAYDGPAGFGSGRTITANYGAVKIQGNDGLNVTGKIGIGNDNPLYKLDVYSTDEDFAVRLSNSQANGKGLLVKAGLGGAVPQNPILLLTNVDNYVHFVVQADGKVGIGTSSPYEKLDINGKLHMRDNIKLNGHWLSGDGDNEGIFVNNSGDVGIGTANTDALLTVAGKIHSQEIEITVDAGEGADYVFEDKYKLKNIFEIEEFIKQNKHLPGIPSASEMQTNGINIGDFQLQLLQKIEELTLYIISQDKEINRLKEKIKD